MTNKFIKMHGLGNDFAIFDGRAGKVEFSAGRLKALGDRRTGIGFDQLIVMEPTRTAQSDIYMRIFNCDGSEVSACGNATRCVAQLLAREMNKNKVTIETKAGFLVAEVDGDMATVDMGEAYLDWNHVPLSHETDTISLDLSVGTLAAPVAVGMGNPHAVFFVDDVMSVPLETYGPQVEHHPLFPERTNVEIAQVLSRHEIRMRVWERGAGITQACGTGACAAAVAAIRRGLTERKVTVLLDGGPLEIEWRERDGHVLMTGAVATVFAGETLI